MRFKTSRLQKMEERKSFKQAFLFLLLTIGLLTVLVTIGVPLIIKLAIYMGNIRGSDEQQNEQVLLVQPRLLPIPAATNSAQLIISGFAPEGTTVKIYLNGAEEDQTQTTEEGEFSFKKIILKTGQNEIKAVSFLDNKESKPYETSIIYKTTPPDLTLSSPGDKEEYFDAEFEIPVSGKTDPDASVYINSRLAIVNQDGSFSSNYSLAEGENKIEIVAVDLAGNKAEKTLTIFYTP